MSGGANSFIKVLLAATVLIVGACSLPSSIEDPVSYKLNVDGQPYLLHQLTAGTWTVSAPGETRLVSSTSLNKAALLQAIEETSGCKVTDSDYSHQGAQLDAQVDCASHLKN